MKTSHTFQPSAASAVAIFEPASDTLYPLDTVARMLDVPRRWIAHSARHGLIHPVVDSATDGWSFDAKAIQTLRRIQSLQTLHHLDLDTIKLVLDLVREVESLRAEVSFLRAR
jgi:DNA-binding transcriptional MerR regulator